MPTRILRPLLILYTLVFVPGALLVLFAPATVSAWVPLDRAERVLRAGMVLMYVLVLWANWSRTDLDRSKRWSNTWMIILLNVIGMWLFLWRLERLEDDAPTDRSDEPH